MTWDLIIDFPASLEKTFGLGMGGVERFSDRINFCM